MLSVFKTFEHRPALKTERFCKDCLCRSTEAQPVRCCKPTFFTWMLQPCIMHGALLFTVSRSSQIRDIERSRIRRLVSRPYSVANVVVTRCYISLTRRSLQTVYRIVIGQLRYLDDHHGKTKTRDLDMSTDPDPRTYIDSFLKLY